MSLRSPRGWGPERHEDTAILLQRLKTEIARNRAKSASLGALLVVLAVVAVRSVGQMNPRGAAAFVPPADGLAGAAGEAGEAGSAAATQPATDLEERARQAQSLWGVLREKRGLEPKAAFFFEPDYYAPDPSRKVAPAPEPERVADPLEKSPAPLADVESETARLARVQGQSRQLVLQAVLLGNTPTALINSELKRVGDHVGGFTIRSIQERQVVVEKDGVTLAVEMSK